MGAASPNYLYCSLCWFMSARGESDAVAVVSVVGGYALCEDHMQYAPLDAATFHRLIAENHREYP